MEKRKSKKLLSMLVAGLLLCFPGSYVLASGAAAQDGRTVSGTVVDVQGDPMIGVSVSVQGTRDGVVTDMDGRYSIRVQNDRQTLLFSYIGYKAVTVAANKDLINVTMAEDSRALDEVVVVGYGLQKKVNLTGSVSTVDVSKVMEARPQADVGKALQGVVPGLTVLNSSGRLNATPTITIRGIGTLSNSGTSKPFIVVDGVPMEDISYLNPQDIENVSVLKDAASTSIYGTRAAFGVILITTKTAKKTDKARVNYTNNFAWNTPTILPDYPDVPTQVRAYREVNTQAKLTPELFGMLMDDTFIAKAEAWYQRHGKRSGYREMIEGDDFEVIGGPGGVTNFYADWDVVGIWFRDWTPSQSHNVSVQGSSGKTSYYMSFGYDHQESEHNFNPNKLNKHSARINLTTDVTKWLQVGGRFSYNDRVYTGANNRMNEYEYLWRWGSFFGPYGTLNGIDPRNPIGARNQAGETKINNALTRLGAFLKADITKGLTFNADYTVDIVNYNDDQVWLPFITLNSWGADITGPLTTVSAPSASYARQQNTRNNSYTFNAYANYEFKLAGNHNFNLMAGANAEEGEVRMFWARRDNLMDYNLPELVLATGDQTVGSSRSQWGSGGWFGRLNYDYKGIYLLELNGRYDGSSQFPVSNRWAFFPSGSIGYRFSEETYFDVLRKTINNAKIRASFGQIGNQEVGSNMFTSVLSNTAATSMYWLNSAGEKLKGFGLPTMVSEILKWERLETLNIGLDLGILNQFNVSADWFQRTNIGMLSVAQTMPQVLGTGAPRVNAGSLRTRGWEVTIDWRHKFNDVNVYANASIGDYKTIVTEWQNDSPLLNSNYSGKIYGAIWGFETDRYFTADDFNADGTYKDGIASQTSLQIGSFVYGPGDIKFKDLDGSGVIDGGAGTIDDHGDLKIIGNTTPRYQYSFRLGGDWNGFDLDLFFQGVGKRDQWTTGAFVMPFMRGADAIYAHQTNYWTEENPDPNADYPRLFPGNDGQGRIAVIGLGNKNFYPQSKYLVNAAYLRLKNLTLGYTLPAELIRKAQLDKVRVYFSANNLCELINKNRHIPIDPEVNSSEGSAEGTNGGTWGRHTPMFRTISFGLQVTF